MTDMNEFMGFQNIVRVSRTLYLFPDELMQDREKDSIFHRHELLWLLKMVSFNP